MTSATTIRARRRIRRDDVVKFMFVVPAAIYVLLFFGYPIVKNLTMSFQEYTTKTFFTGEAPWVGLDNYVTAITSNLFGPSLINTALFTAGSLIGQFVIGLALALFFQKKFPLSSVMRALLLLPWLLPLIVASATWRSILDQDSGILNRFLGAIGLDAVPWLTSPDVALIAVIIVNIWVGIPFNVTLLYGGLQDIPEELYEAAALDGAGRWRTFLTVTLPSIRPVAAFVVVTSFISAAQLFDEPYLLTKGGPGESTLSVAMFIFRAAFERQQFGYAAAAGVVLFAIVFLVSQALNRILGIGRDQ